MSAPVTLWQLVEKPSTSDKHFARITPIQVYNVGWPKTPKQTPPRLDSAHSFFLFYTTFEWPPAGFASRKLIVKQKKKKKKKKKRCPRCDGTDGNFRCDRHYRKVSNDGQSTCKQLLLALGQVRWISRRRIFRCP